MSEVPLEDILNDHLVRIEALETMVHQLSEHMSAQNHLLHVLARQISMVAEQNDVDIRMRFN